MGGRKKELPNDFDSPSFPDELELYKLFETCRAYVSSNGARTTKADQDELLAEDELTSETKRPSPGILLQRRIAKAGGLLERHGEPALAKSLYQSAIYRDDPERFATYLN